MSISSVVSSVLKAAAPTLLTAIALPPPFNLIASAVVSGALGKFLPAGEEPAQPQPGSAPVLSPGQVTSVIEKNAANPELLAQLREAEQKLKDYEAANNLKFAELDVQDRARAGSFQATTGTAHALLAYGMAIVFISIAAMMGIIIGSLLLISNQVSIPAANAQLAVGVFGLVGAVVGYVSGYASQIVGFYYGSSQGSNEKTDALSSVLQQQGQQIGRAAQVAASTADTAAAQAAKVLDKAVTIATAGKAAPDTGTADTARIASLPFRQGPFGGLRWQVTPDGILTEGETVPDRTIGDPATVRRIWRDFGDIIKEQCAAHRVPAEVVVTTIAVESGGRVEALVTEPDGRTSVGLMQTLIGTASDVMGRAVTGAELQMPAIAIEAGTRVIAKQREMTKFDPILTAAAYNAGSLEPPRPEDVNPFKLRSTKDHLMRTKLFFNDTVATARAEKWFV